MAGLRWRWT